MTKLPILLVPYGGIFCKGFIFASQEPFVKIKTAKMLLTTCEVNELRFNPRPTYTAANRSMSASVPLTAIAETIQEIEMLAT